MAELICQSEDGERSVRYLAALARVGLSSDRELQSLERGWGGGGKGSPGAGRGRGVLGEVRSEMGDVVVEGMPVVILRVTRRAGF